MNFHASVDIKSAKLLALAREITEASRMDNAAGIRPIVMSLLPGDYVELHSFAISVAGFMGLDESAVLMTAENFEKIVRSGSDPGLVVVITDGENISRAVQARIVGRGLPNGITPPPIFIVATNRDPGDLVRDERWVISFRAVFARHWPWPSIKTRKLEYPKLFRAGVDLAAAEQSLPSPEINGGALKMVRAITIDDVDGARAILRLGAKACSLMHAYGDSRITSQHVLVSLPGTRPSSRPPQESASAS